MRSSSSFVVVLPRIWRANLWWGRTWPLHSAFVCLVGARLARRLVVGPHLECQLFCRSVTDLLFRRRGPFPKPSVSIEAWTKTAHRPLRTGRAEPRINVLCFVALLA